MCFVRQPWQDSVWLAGQITLRKSKSTNFTNNKVERGRCLTPYTPDFGFRILEKTGRRRTKNRGFLEGCWYCFRVTSEACLFSQDPSDSEIFAFRCCEVCVLSAERHKNLYHHNEDPTDPRQAFVFKQDGPYQGEDLRLEDTADKDRKRSKKGKKAA